MSGGAALRDLGTEAGLRRGGSSLSRALVVFGLLVLFGIDPSSLLVGPSWGPPGVVVVGSFGQKSGRDGGTSAGAGEGLGALAAGTAPTVVGPAGRVGTVRSMSGTVRSGPDC